MSANQINPGLWQPGDYFLHAYCGDMGAGGQTGTEAGQAPFVVPFRSRLIQIGTVIENSNGSDYEIDTEGLAGVKTVHQLGAYVDDANDISGGFTIPNEEQAESDGDGVSPLVFDKGTYRVRSDGTGATGPEGHFWLHMRPDGGEHIQYGDFLIISG